MNPNFLLRGKEAPRLHQAYLLAGSSEREKDQFILNLFDRFGGHRERAEKKSHPDFVSLEPENGIINVDSIRSLPKTIAFAPLEAQKRFIVFSQADCLNVQASNAFLKILEEPPPHTHFFLKVPEPSSLLQTILSRSQVLRFSPISEDEIRKELTANSVPPKEEYIAWISGSRDRLQILVASPDREMIIQAIDLLLKMWKVAPRIPHAAISFLDSIDSESKLSFVIDSWQLLLGELFLHLASQGKGTQQIPRLQEEFSSLTVGFSPEFQLECHQRMQAFSKFREQQKFHGNLKLDLMALLTALQIPASQRN